MEGASVRCAGRWTAACRESKIETAERVRQAADVFEVYGDEIRAMISLNVKEQSTVDDMFQNLFLSVVRSPIPPGTDRVVSYLYRIIANDLIDENRRLSNYAEFVRGYRECGCLSETQQTPESGAIEIEETHAMLQLLRKQLPAHEAEAVVHKYFHGRETTDAAERMQVDNKTFSQYAYRGKRKIRRLHRKMQQKQGD